MADNNLRNPENVPGAYYVDNTCIDCGLCPATAPLTFRRNDENGFSVAYHQPQSPEEIAQAEEARLACPTDSIGGDGDLADSTTSATAEFAAPSGAKSL